MIFSSTIFLFIFLPVTLILFYIIPRKYISLKITVLLAASIVFFAWGEPRNVFIILASTVCNYMFGLGLEKTEGNHGSRKAIFILAIVFNLGLLFYFKYFNFVTGNRFGYIALPIGISFFMFQIMSYVIDVYLGNVKAQHNPAKLTLYIMLFPQLIAGPIVRYIDVEEQLSTLAYDEDSIFRGISRFIMGLSKKVLISNIVAAFADTAFAVGSGLNAATAWLGAICYALQIYFDFSGYSDMAIGLGHMFGFTFCENFNYPYISASVQEFWRRWHISLSTWFRDYLYIPLGGNRKGTARTYINLIIVFACTGIWHGAAWTFLMWGLGFFVLLVIEKYTPFGKWIGKRPLGYLIHLPNGVDVPRVGVISRLVFDYRAAGLEQGARKTA